ncbi:MAG: hypothetical protein WHT29_11965 [Bacteroidales bacterium]
MKTKTSYFQIIKISVVVVLCSIVSCEKADSPFLKQEKFISRFVVINQSQERLYFQFEGVIVFPNKNQYQFIYKDAGFLFSMDSSYLDADTIYKNCQLQMAVRIRKNLTNQEKYIIRYYLSKLIKVENKQQKDMRFIWPKDTNVFELTKIDTVDGLIH